MSMHINEMVARYPALGDYVKNIPEEMKTRFTLKAFPPHSIIHQKGDEINAFGIVCSGRHRVINEFENGNIFMIEKNAAISFIGEVTLLAGHRTSSVTIETLTECQIIFFSSEDFFQWIGGDIGLLRRLTQSISHKLYSASYSSGERQYHSARYLVMKYLVKYGLEHRTSVSEPFLVAQTREEIGEELGMTVKTLNRAVAALKQEGALRLRKGKMLVSPQQYALMEKVVRASISDPGKKA
jgi:CRP/FNR family cyclic AMP-dependent transcriptional regulator